MKVAIHQPHYFPWIGYFDKMAKCDAFILLDEVQLEKNSQMVRNRVLDQNGEIKYLTISGDTKGFLEKKYNELSSKNNDEWKSRQLNALKNYYREAPFFSETYELVDDFLKHNYGTICEWTCASINRIKEILDIKTDVIMQSSIDYKHGEKKSDLVLELCSSIDADVYLSGRGFSQQYLQRDDFLKKGIEIEFQNFEHPIYNQHSKEFVPGLSILDMLFNCGINTTKDVFWKQIMERK